MFICIWLFSYFGTAISGDDLVADLIIPNFVYIVKFGLNFGIY